MRRNYNKTFSHCFDNKLVCLIESMFSQYVLLSNRSLIVNIEDTAQAVHSSFDYRGFCQLFSPY